MLKAKKIMKRLHKHVVKTSKAFSAHVKKHGKKYIFGGFGTFAIVKAVMFFVGLMVGSGNATLATLFQSLGWDVGGETSEVETFGVEDEYAKNLASCLGDKDQSIKCVQNLFFGDEGLYKEQIQNLKTLLGDKIGEGCNIAEIVELDGEQNTLDKIIEKSQQLNPNTLYVLKSGNNQEFSKQFTMGNCSLLVSDRSSYTVLEYKGEGGDYLIDASTRGITVIRGVVLKSSKGNIKTGLLTTPESPVILDHVSLANIAQVDEPMIWGGGLISPVIPENTCRYQSNNDCGTGFIWDGQCGCVCNTGAGYTWTPTPFIYNPTDVTDPHQLWGDWAWDLNLYGACCEPGWYLDAYYEYPCPEEGHPDQVCSMGGKGCIRCDATNENIKNCVDAGGNWNWNICGCSCLGQSRYNEDLNKCQCDVTEEQGNKQCQQYGNGMVWSSEVCDCDCPEGQVLENGSCVPVSVLCPNEEELKSQCDELGNDVAYREDCECKCVKEGYQYINGECKESQALCDNGQEEIDSCTTWNRDKCECCPEGYVVESGECVNPNCSESLQKACEESGKKWTENCECVCAVEQEEIDICRESNGVWSTDSCSCSCEHGKILNKLTGKCEENNCGDPEDEELQKKITNCNNDTNGQWSAEKCECLCSDGYYFDGEICIKDEAVAVDNCNNGIYVDGNCSSSMPSSTGSIVSLNGSKDTLTSAGGAKGSSFESTEKVEGLYQISSKNSNSFVVLGKSSSSSYKIKGTVVVDNFAVAAVDYSINPPELVYKYVDGGIIVAGKKINPLVVYNVGSAEGLQLTLTEGNNFTIFFDLTDLVNSPKNDVKIGSKLVIYKTDDGETWEKNGICEVKKFDAGIGCYMVSDSLSEFAFDWENLILTCDKDKDGCTKCEDDTTCYCNAEDSYYSDGAGGCVNDDERICKDVDCGDGGVLGIIEDKETGKSSCICLSCGDGYQLNQENGTCEGGDELIKKQCQESGGTWTDDTCKCADGYEWNADDLKCVEKSESTVTCDVGNYFDGDKCKKCTAGNYCVGGTFTSNGGVQGLESCPSGYTSSAGATSQSECKKTVTVTFNMNGAESVGSGSKSCEMSYNSTCQVTAPSITRSGFDIKGWSTNSSATSGSVAVNGNITLNGNATYYAITSKVVTGTFNKGNGVDTVTPTTRTCMILNTATTCDISMASATCILGYYNQVWNPSNLNNLSSNTSSTATCSSCPAKPELANWNAQGTCGWTCSKGSIKTGETCIACTSIVGGIGLEGENCKCVDGMKWDEGNGICIPNGGISQESCNSLGLQFINGQCACDENYVWSGAKGQCVYAGVCKNNLTEEYCSKLEGVNQSKPFDGSNPENCACICEKGYEWNGKTCEASCGELTLSATNSSNSWKNANINIVLNVSLEGKCLGYAKYIWDKPSDCISKGTDFTSGTNISLSNEGTHTLYLCAQDSAGAEQTWSGVYKLDKTAPVCSLTSDVAQISQGGNTNIVLTCTESNGIQTSVSSNTLSANNGAIAFAYSGKNGNIYTYTFSYTAGTNGAGIDTITLDAGKISDVAGNTNVATGIGIEVIGGWLQNWDTSTLFNNLYGVNSLYVENWQNYSIENLKKICPNFKDTPVVVVSNINDFMSHVHNSKLDTGNIYIIKNNIESNLNSTIRVGDCTAIVGDHGRIKFIGNVSKNPIFEMEGSYSIIDGLVLTNKTDNFKGVYVKSPNNTVHIAYSNGTNIKAPFVSRLFSQSNITINVGSYIDGNNLVEIDKTSPTCNWVSDSTGYVKNGSEGQFILHCVDLVDGVKTKSISPIYDNNYISLNAAVDATDSDTVDYIFTYTGKNVNYGLTQLDNIVVEDENGNKVNVSSPSIVVDNVGPNCVISGNPSVSIGDTVQFTISCVDTGGVDLDVNLSDLAMVHADGYQNPGTLTKKGPKTFVYSGENLGVVTITLATGAVVDRAGNTTTKASTFDITVEDLPWNTGSWVNENFWTYGLGLSASSGVTQQYHTGIKDVFFGVSSPYTAKWSNKVSCNMDNITVESVTKPDQLNKVVGNHIYVLENDLNLTKSIEINQPCVVITSRFNEGGKKYIIKYDKTAKRDSLLAWLFGSVYAAESNQSAIVVQDGGVGVILDNLSIQGSNIVLNNTNSVTLNGVVVPDNNPIINNETTQVLYHDTNITMNALSTPNDYLDDDFWDQYNNLGELGNDYLKIALKAEKSPYRYSSSGCTTYGIKSGTEADINNSTLQNDTIYVFDGPLNLYHDVTINNKCIALLGMSGVSVNMNGYSLTVNGDNAIVDGFIFSGGKYINVTSHNQFSTVNNISVYGMTTPDTTGAVFLEKNVIFTNSKVLNNKGKAKGALAVGASNILNNLQVFNNNLLYGIHIIGGGNAVNNTQIYNNKESGIYVGGTNNVLNNMQSYKNMKEGFVVGGGNYISKIQSYNNGGYGLQISGSGSVHICGDANDIKVGTVQGGVMDANCGDNSSPTPISFVGNKVAPRKATLTSNSNGLVDLSQIGGVISVVTEDEGGNVDKSAVGDGPCEGSTDNLDISVSPGYVCVGPNKSATVYGSASSVQYVDQDPTNIGLHSLGGTIGSFFDGYCVWGTSDPCQGGNAVANCGHSMHTITYTATSATFRAGYCTYNGYGYQFCFKSASVTVQSDSSYPSSVTVNTPIVGASSIAATWTKAVDQGCGSGTIKYTPKICGDTNCNTVYLTGSSVYNATGYTFDALQTGSIKMNENNPSAYFVVIYCDNVNNCSKAYSQITIPSFSCSISVSDENVWKKSKNLTLNVGGGLKYKWWNTNRTNVGSTQSVSTTVASNGTYTGYVLKSIWEKACTKTVSKIDNTKPTAPGVSDITTGNLLPLFTWTASQDTQSGLSGYRLYIYQGSGCAGNSILRFTTGTSLRYNGNDLSIGSYSWKVRAEDRAGNEVYSNCAQLTINPGCTLGQSISSGCAKTGYLNLSITNTISSGTANISGWNSTFYPLNQNGNISYNISADGLYTGYVSGTNYKGMCTWVVTGIDREGPTIGTLISSGNFVNIAPNLSWSATESGCSQISKYVVKVCKNLNCTQVSYQSSNLSGSTSSYILDRALSAGQYYWVLEAYDALGNKSTSGVLFQITYPSVAGNGSDGSWNYVTNPKNNAGYLSDWLNSAGYKKGYNSGFVLLPTRYSFGKSILPQAQLYVINGSNVSLPINTHNYIGSDLERVDGELEFPNNVAIGNPTAITGKSTAGGNLVRLYAITGLNISGPLGNTIGSALSGVIFNTAKNRIVMQMTGVDYFATHLENNYEIPRCLTGWDNDNFIDESFWSNYTTASYLICALYGGFGEQDETAYTHVWGDHDCNATSGSMTVVSGTTAINAIKNHNLQSNRIYLLTGGVISINGGVLNVPKCTSIISMSGVTISGQVNFGDAVKHYSILDNVSIKGNFSNIGINVGEDMNFITVVNSKIYNHDIGIQYGRGAGYFVNNVQVFNNKSGGIKAISDIELSSFNNIQSYNNGSHGLHFTNLLKSVLNNIYSYNNKRSNSPDAGIYIEQYSDSKFYNLNAYNNTYGLYYSSDEPMDVQGTHNYIFGNDNNNGGNIFNEVFSWESPTWNNEIIDGVSWDWMTNPTVGITGDNDSYLNSFAILEPNDLRGYKSSFNGVVKGYSYGKNIGGQVRPIDVDGNEFANADVNKYVGSNVNRDVNGEVSPVVKSHHTGQYLVSVTGDMSKYSLFNPFVYGQNKGSLSYINGDRFVVQLNSGDYFATHFQVDIDTNAAGNNCLDDYVGDRFMDRNFWSQNPNYENIVCALYGADGKPGKDQYETVYDNRFDIESAPYIGVVVVENGNIIANPNSVLGGSPVDWQNAPGDILYIILGTFTGDVVLNNDSAIVGYPGAKIVGNITAAQYNVFDDIEIQGSLVLGSTNVVNNVQVHNSSIGIRGGDSSVINNTQVFNNNIGLFFVSNVGDDEELPSLQNLVNNVQVFNNDYGIYFEKAWVSINNTQIYNNDNLFKFEDGYAGAKILFNNISSYNNNDLCYIGNDACKDKDKIELSDTLFVTNNYMEFNDPLIKDEYYFFEMNSSKSPENPVVTNVGEVESAWRDADYLRNYITNPIVLGSYLNSWSGDISQGRNASLANGRAKFSYGVDVLRQAEPLWFSDNLEEIPTMPEFVANYIGYFDGDQFIGGDVLDGKIDINMPTYINATKLNTATRLTGTVGDPSVFNRYSISGNNLLSNYSTYTNINNGKSIRFTSSGDGTYVIGQFSGAYFGEHIQKNIIWDRRGPTIASFDNVSGYECQDITLLIEGDDDHVDSLSFRFTGSLIPNSESGWNSTMDGVYGLTISTGNVGSYTVYGGVRDSVNNSTGDTAVVEVQDSLPSFASGDGKLYMTFDVNQPTTIDLNDFYVVDGSCGTGTIGFTGNVINSSDENLSITISSTGVTVDGRPAEKVAGSFDVLMTDDEGNIITGTVYYTFDDNCLAGRDNDRFIDEEFWNLWKAVDPGLNFGSGAYLACAIFGYHGNIDDSKTAYNGKFGGACRLYDPSNPVYTTSVDNFNGEDNYINVFTSDQDLGTLSLSLGKCAAIVGYPDPLAPSLYSKGIEMTNYAVVDGVTLKEGGLSIKNDTNTVNNIEIYGALGAGLNIGGGDNIVNNVKSHDNVSDGEKSLGVLVYSEGANYLNNLQLFGNNVGIAVDAGYIDLTNTQIYNNQIGIENEGGNITLENSQVYLNMASAINGSITTFDNVSIVLDVNEESNIAGACPEDAQGVTCDSVDNVSMVDLVESLTNPLYEGYEYMWDNFAILEDIGKGKSLQSQGGGDQWIPNSKRVIGYSYGNQVKTQNHNNVERLYDSNKFIGGGVKKINGTIAGSSTVTAINRKATWSWNGENLNNITQNYDIFADGKAIGNNISNGINVRLSAGSGDKNVVVQIGDLDNGYFAQHFVKSATLNIQTPTCTLTPTYPEGTCTSGSVPATINVVNNPANGQSDVGIWYKLDNGAYDSNSQKNITSAGRHTGYVAYYLYEDGQVDILDVGTCTVDVPDTVIDQKGPNISIVSPLAGTSYVAGLDLMVSITGTANSNNVGCNTGITKYSYEVRENNKNGTIVGTGEIPVSNNETTYSFSFTGAENGQQYYLVVRGYDGLGNVNSTNRTFRYRIKPGLLIGVPRNISQTITRGQTGTFSFATPFWVEDRNGAESGWYTTIQSNGFYKLGATTPTFTGLMIMSSGFTLSGGFANGTEVNSGLNTYTDITEPVIYMYRADGQDQNGALNRYEDYPSFRIHVPSNVENTGYNAQVVYTLYDNGITLNDIVNAGMMEIGYGQIVNQYPQSFGLYYNWLPEGNRDAELSGYRSNYVSRSPNALTSEEINAITGKYEVLNYVWSIYTGLENYITQSGLLSLYNAGNTTKDGLLQATNNKVEEIINNSLNGGNITPFAGTPFSFSTYTGWLKSFVSDNTVIARDYVTILKKLNNKPNTKSYLTGKMAVINSGVNFYSGYLTTGEVYVVYNNYGNETKNLDTIKFNLNGELAGKINADFGGSVTEYANKIMEGYTQSDQVNTQALELLNIYSKAAEIDTLVKDLKIDADFGASGQYLDNYYDNKVSAIVAVQSSYQDIPFADIVELYDKYENENGAPSDIDFYDIVDKLEGLAGKDGRDSIKSLLNYSLTEILWAYDELEAGGQGEVGVAHAQTIIGKRSELLSNNTLGQYMDWLSDVSYDVKWGELNDENIDSLASDKYQKLSYLYDIYDGNVDKEALISGYNEGGWGEESVGKILNKLNYEYIGDIEIYLSNYDSSGNIIKFLSAGFEGKQEVLAHEIGLWLQAMVKNDREFVVNYTNKANVCMRMLGENIYDIDDIVKAYDFYVGERGYSASTPSDLSGTLNLLSGVNAIIENNRYGPVINFVNWIEHGVSDAIKVREYQGIMNFNGNDINQWYQNKYDVLTEAYDIYNGYMDKEYLLRASSNINWEKDFDSAKFEFIFKLLGEIDGYYKGLPLGLSEILSDIGDPDLVNSEASNILSFLSSVPKINGEIDMNTINVSMRWKKWNYKYGAIDKLVKEGKKKDSLVNVYNSDIISAGIEDFVYMSDKYDGEEFTYNVVSSILLDGLE